ncbi:hypothetical protein Tco_0989604 [Tanacetum coccineum]|uniref:Uncharacterized protein n=1 Tax=Tanacetum coccineum TaxID=301880 RepID=A0ABQ5EU99_9ASTR
MKLGLRYGALRRRELTLEDGDVYSTFEVRQGSGLAPGSERLERTRMGSQLRIKTMYVESRKRCCRDNPQTLAAEWGFELRTPVVDAISYLGERPK